MFLKESSTTITYQNMKPSVIFIMGKKSEIFNIFFPKVQDLFLSKFPLFFIKNFLPTKISSHSDWPDGGFLDMGHYSISSDGAHRLSFSFTTDGTHGA